MKLIDLLVQELPKRGGWPNGAEIAVQDADSQICFSSHSDVYANKGQTDWYGGDWVDGDWSNPFIDTIADDRHECIVTRNQYEAALAASEGWIEWHGGKCPVDSDAIVEVRCRWHNPRQYNNDRAGDFYWEHTGSGGDIIAYRLHDQNINNHTNDDRLEQDLNECIGQDVDVPEWNGDGLPPVGTVCMANLANGWTDVKVAYIGDEGGCREALVFEIKSTKPAWADEFRPLRTEAERARDKLAASLHIAAGASPIELNGIGLLYFKLADAIISGSVFGTTFKAGK